MPKNRPSKYKQHYHGNQADPDWWRTALKRRKQGNVFSDHLTTEGFLELIHAYLNGEIPAAIFGVSCLRAFENRETSGPEIEEVLLCVEGLAISLPGFDPIDDVFERSETEVKSLLTPYASELRWHLDKARSRSDDR